MKHPPREAEAIFGDRLPQAARYAELLATEGILRGLLGPREAGRLWDRHLLNCAVVADLFPAHARVADLGSGAGLPGVVLALLRPDLHVTLVEPLLRRTRFLDEVVATLGLDNAEVLRARAEALRGRCRFDVVTSRAVAPLDRLLGWSLPLVEPGGAVVALKGGAAADEVAALMSDADVRRRLPCEPEVLQRGGNQVSVPTTVVRVLVPAGPDLDSDRPLPGTSSRRRERPRR